MHFKNLPDSREVITLVLLTAIPLSLSVSSPVGSNPPTSFFSVVVTVVIVWELCLRPGDQTAINGIMQKTIKGKKKKASRSA